MAERPTWITEAAQRITYELLADDDEGAASLSWRGHANYIAEIIEQAFNSAPSEVDIVAELEEADKIRDGR